MHFRSLFILFCFIFSFSIAGWAQDQIFLKNGDGVLDCFIISVSDSLITFRTLDSEDKTEYEIPYSDTYGFLLEDPMKLQAAEMMYSNELWISHPRKKRHPILKPGKTMLYRLKSDTLLFPKRGKIIGLSADSMQVELKRRKKVEHIQIAVDDVAMFGYTTFMTEMLTLIIIPASSVAEGSLQIYRKLPASKGWTWKVMPPGEEQLSQRKYRRKFRKGQLLNLPKSVRKKTLRDQRGK